MNITNGEISKEAMIVVGSLAKGTEQHLRLLIDANAVPILLINTQSDVFRFVEASLRCLRTIFKSPLAPFDLIYLGINSLSPSSSICTNQSPILPHLISLAANNKSSYVIKECVANILAASCQVCIIQLNHLLIIKFIFLDNRASKYYERPWCHTSHLRIYS